MEAPVIAVVTIFSGSIPAIAGIARYKRLDNAMKVFTVFCTVSFLSEIWEYLLGRSHVNNTSLSNYYVPVEVIFLCIVYLLSIHSRRVRQTLLVLTLLFLCLWILDKIYFDIPGQMNGEMAITSRIVIILISVLTIHTIVKQINHPFFEEPIFWVSSGSLIYSAGVALIVGEANELLKIGTSFYVAAWYINWSLEILCNLIFTKGFFCTTKYQILYG